MVVSVSSSSQPWPRLAWGLSCLLLTAAAASAYAPPVPPRVSPATNLPNELYAWRGDHQIRYQVAGPPAGAPVLLVHGLFVNSDHWRKTIVRLASEGYRAYAIDLWGCGYSSKPPRDSAEARAVNGEAGRFRGDGEAPGKIPKILKQARLGSACGTKTRVVDVELCHPLSSPYNFYTWSDLLTDFSRQVILKDALTNPAEQPQQQIALVSNSIGTISSLQAVLDAPGLFSGVFVVSPNFRELHSAELPLSWVSMPVVRTVQRLLRDSLGQPLFDALAKPGTVKRILKEPYAVQSAVDDVLVDVLLAPLLTEGASQVVFDTLSYSAGPLPELQLQELAALAEVESPQSLSSSSPSSPPAGLGTAARRTRKPVWVVYGEADPWTPAARVEALGVLFPNVERVVALPGVGHCPHDEAPELVEPILLEFLKRNESQQKQ